MFCIICTCFHRLVNNLKLSLTVSDIGHNIIQDAFLIAVEEQARQRLQRLSALKRITPVDMSKLSVEVSFFRYICST